jgi:hypothetical protein
MLCPHEGDTPGAGGYIQDHSSPWSRDRFYRFMPPPPVSAQADQGVDQVVSWRQPAEHLLD